MQEPFLRGPDLEAVRVQGTEEGEGGQLHQNVVRPFRAQDAHVHITQGRGLEGDVYKRQRLNSRVSAVTSYPSGW